MKQDPPPPPWVRDLGKMGVITWNLVIYTLLGFLLGYGAWQKFGVPQWLMAVTSLIGMGLGFFQIFRMFREQK